MARRATTDADFERLWTEHAEPLLRFLIYRTGNRTLAEDVVAGTFERVIRSSRRFDRRRGSEKTWLYSIALNIVRDHARHEAVVTRTIETGLLTPARPGGPEAFDQVDDRDLVQRALTGLAAEEREAIALRYGADLTVPEIAELLDQPLSTIEGRVYRALRKLRTELA
jgi:RNA polymerase sigma factor (sigma-70 family)